MAAALALGGATAARADDPAADEPSVSVYSELPAGPGGSGGAAHEAAAVHPRSALAAAAAGATGRSGLLLLAGVIVCAGGVALLTRRAS